jgi:hypothetical protein
MDRLSAISKGREQPDLLRGQIYSIRSAGASMKFKGRSTLLRRIRTILEQVGIVIGTWQDRGSRGKDEVLERHL